MENEGKNDGRFDPKVEYQTDRVGFLGQKSRALEMSDNRTSTTPVTGSRDSHAGRVSPKTELSVDVCGPSFITLEDACNQAIEVAHERRPSALILVWENECIKRGRFDRIRLSDARFLDDEPWESE